MKNKRVFKSEESKQRVLSHYKNLLNNLTVSYQERFIDTSYGKTYLLEVGNKDNPTVFLLHGSCSNSAMWFGDIPTLSKDYHVFSVDIIGEAGNSAEKRLDLKGDEYAKWIYEIYNATETRKAMLVGNSYGGWLSLKFAINYPECVEKLVLIATSGITPPKLSFILKSIFHSLQGKKGLKSLNKLVYGTDDIPDEVIEVSNMIMESFNPKLGSLPVYKDEELKKLNMPVMYIAGEKDVTVHADKTADRLKNIIPHTKISLIKDNGHVIYDAMDRIMPFLGE